MGFTTSGEFVFGTRPDSGDVQLATLDAAGRLTDAAKPLAGNFTGNRFLGAWSPDGRHLVYLSQVPYQHNQKHLSIYTARTGEVRTIPVAMRWFFLAVSWDADNRHVLLQGSALKNELGLHRVDIDSGRLDYFPDQPGTGSSRNYFYPLAMPPDGASLFFARGERQGGLIRRDLATSQETVIVDGPLVAFALSSDGRQLAVIRRYGPDGQPIGRETRPNAVDVIQVVSASGGQPREIFKGAKLGTTIAWAPDGQSVYFGQMPAGSVWRVPTTGGEAQELPIKVEGLAHISIHPDGRQLAVSSRTRLQEVLAMGPFAVP
jgi:Tol biopolymer transport system component